MKTHLIQQNRTVLHHIVRYDKVHYSLYLKSPSKLVHPLERQSGGTIQTYTAAFGRTSGADEGDEDSRD